MLHGAKIRLCPTKEQECLFFKSAGVARWAYNYAITRNKESYEVFKEDKVSKVLTANDIRKEVTVLKNTTHPWLKEVGSNVPKQAIKDWDKALQRGIRGLSGFPKYKRKYGSTFSFYVNYESFKRVQGGFRGEKVGFVKTSQPLPKLPRGVQYYSNPRISYDGKYWYISFSYPINPLPVTLTEDIIGIDLGIKTLATCSNGLVVNNINKSNRVRLLEKRLRRKQRHLSRQLKANTKEYKIVNGYRIPVYKRPLHTCSNIVKTKKEIKLLYRTLKGIRDNHLHQTTSKLVKTLPKAIVIEDLNVQGMLKNKHLSKAIKDAKFYEFRRQLAYKSAKYGIDLVVADRFYPSSKVCSSCLTYKKDLKLKDRVYHCDSCGISIDRDLNASYNLEYYYYRPLHIV